MPLFYREGDATQAVADESAPGPRVIAHICNDVGGWGAGFVLALSRRWPEPERAYRHWYAERTNAAPEADPAQINEPRPFALGEIQLVEVEAELSVVNMIAQRDVRSVAGRPPIRYDALQRCLRLLAREADGRGASVHMPRIGCGLAGGTWDEVGRLVDTELVAADVDVYVYDFR